MNKPRDTGVKPTRQEDYPEWYQSVIRAGDLAETSPVRGCMVIKPWGFGIWEAMQRVLDGKFKATGHKNAYFPLFIPLSFLEKEAAHVDGFAKECAVVTHHRLIAGPDGKLMVDPEAKLEEPLVVRPTSETIIGEMFAKWITSYRDLPVLINQWANVVRWEMRTRLFLRTTEFLWQEGHTAHATEEDARAETRQMLDVYADFAESYMAVPVVRGIKTASERFPGAVDTFCIEAMMQDRKALQAGTSHFLGQNFAKASGIQFQGKDGATEHAWTTSWGVSTRLIGALIMAHADDDGMVVPPRIAPTHVAILPILRGDDTEPKVLAYAREVAAALRAVTFDGRPLDVELDARELRGGEKTWEWIRKGVPLRIEVGPRDVDGRAVMVARRDQGPRDKAAMTLDELVGKVASILSEQQAVLLDRARKFREEHTHEITDAAAFKAFFTAKNASKPEIHGGYALSPWCGETACEERVKDSLKVTIRCLPLDRQAPAADATCAACGAKATDTALFAKAY